MSKFFLLFLCLNITTVMFSQNDCITHLQVCGNQSISSSVSGGGIQEISNSQWCFSNEHNSIWFRFTIATGGTLGFTLIPSSTAITEDYDFMVFAASATCTNLGNPIRCSSTNPQAANSSNNLTGMNASSSDYLEGPGANGDSWIHWLNVNAGESYYLLIDRPIGNAAFTLNWTGTATFKKTYAGTDKKICKGSTATMDATETGTWIPFSSNPSSVSFSSLTSPTAIVSGFNTIGIYNFVWQSVGCSDTVQISVKPTYSSTVSKSICQGKSYLGHNTAGTYIDNLKSIFNCDSIINLNLTVIPTTFSTTNKTICQNQSFWGYSVSGTYTDILVNSRGCDSSRKLVLAVNPISTNTISKTICYGDSFMGKKSSGTYTDIYTNYLGCDSTRIIQLTVRNYLNVTINKAICLGQSYYGYTSSGVYTDHFNSIEGCDSTRTVTLTVNLPSSSIIFDTVCAGSTKYTHTTSGTYTDRLINSVNCDSTRVLHLEVKPNSYFTIDTSICEGNTCLGRSTTGNYQDIYTSVNGCDSTRYLHLLVYTKVINNISKIICEGDNFMGYTLSGFYRDTLRNFIGCDSIISNITLTVISKRYSVDSTICEGDSLFGYKVAGTYIDNIVDPNGCPRIRTLHLKVNPKTYGSETISICYRTSYKGYSQSGIYKTHYSNIYGCDSLFTLNLTVKNDFLIDKLRDTATCEDNSIILTINPNYSSYLWNDGNTSSTRPVVSTGKYTVIVRNRADTCLSYDTCNVILYPTPIVNIGNDTTIYKGELLIINSVVTQPVKSTGFRWYPKELFLCDSCAKQIIELKENSYLKLTYTDFHNCQNMDSINVTLLPVNDFGIPNAFSPNHDLINDTFGINGGPVKSMELKIFDRWGELVYSYIGQNPAWDGTYKGDMVPNGIYVYSAIVHIYGRKTKEMKGSITVIR